MNKRDFRIDIVRAICAIEIIAFWHLMDYLPNYYSLSGMPLHTAKLLTDSSMATFAFISGFCLSKYDVNTKNDAMYFYKRRLKRFYPLLFLSCLSLYAAGFIFHQHWFVSTKQFITTILGLNIFFPPRTPTLYYFSMMMFFYSLTPFILSMKRNKVKQIFVPIAIILAVMLVQISVEIDRCFFLYFPFYVMGLLLPKKIISDIYRYRYPCVVCSFFLFFFFTWLTYGMADFYLGGGRFLAMLSGLVFLFSLSPAINKSEMATKALYYVSYSSMTAYLFHRQIYLSLALLLGDSNKELNLFTAACFAVPCVFVISYMLQKTYDKLISVYESYQKR